MTRLAAVAAAALLGLLTVGVAEGQRQAGAVFTAVVQETHEEYGRVIVRKQLRDRHGDVVGHAATVCVKVFNGTAQCIGTFVLPRGKIMVAGTRRNQEFFVFAVSGGTGLYRGATGELIARTYDKNPRRERIVFEMVLP